MKCSWSRFLNTEEASAMGRAPSKAIRPCCPPINGDANWVYGGAVEVLDKFSVRILGSSSKLSNINLDCLFYDLGKMAIGFWLEVFYLMIIKFHWATEEKIFTWLLGCGAQKKRVLEEGSNGVQRILLRLPLCTCVCFPK
ncbi:hypothetical protein J1N35_034360 [Gossypium stocksii]|uniref:Uncharacterized protein n=1 Tax=Gossypium stocksii TaxID=47602 RepID=A0A9D3URW4_9ROSI|nr:hypothetical protein J1N35_034360 [Gossypium stocksii]